MGAMNGPFTADFALRGPFIAGSRRYPAVRRPAGRQALTGHVVASLGRECTVKVRTSSRHCLDAGTAGVLS